MTELQEMMLYFCFGGMCGVFISEIIIIIEFSVSCVKDKFQKRKESKKARESSTKAE